MNHGISYTVAIFPGSLVHQADYWKKVSGRLPHGTFLLVLPSKPGPVCDVLFCIAADLERRGSMIALIET